jgi:hypothetical protein
MVTDTRELLDHNALLLLAWRHRWPPRHDDDTRYLQETSLKGPWPDIPPPEWRRPLVVSRDRARELRARAFLARVRYFDEIDETTLTLLLVDFLRLAFPDLHADRSEAELTIWITPLFERARARGYAQPEEYVYWPILATIGGDSFDQLPYVNLWLQITYLEKALLLEKLILGANVTLRNPWLAVLIGSGISEVRFEDGTIVRTDNLGTQVIKTGTSGLSPPSSGDPPDQENPAVSATRHRHDGNDGKDGVS